MALTPGKKIGSYEITAQIGVGGMGEVYRATDTRLKREVAIKVLPQALAADAERLARFQREAEVLASLNHPGIAAIYGIEESSAAPGQVGSKALVMELVEGPTLADRIARGAVPVDEALAIAKQIAEALEAAHEQGIIHRDLKPANIKLRPDGTVKVLDFGLAKALEPAGAESSSLSMSPTITTPAMTQAGLILGTAAYMSPEQAKGRPADRRSDVWAFGAVLFEMLVGRRAFEAEDVSETLAAVLMREPDWSWLPATTPAAVVAVLRRCLQKSPKQRMRDIGDVALALEGAFETRAEVATHAAPALPSWRRAIPSAVSAAVVAALLLGIGWSVWPSPARPVIRSVLRLPGGQTLITGLRNVVRISPDGATTVYNSANGFRVHTRDSLSDRPLEIASIMLGPFSPDGQSVAFWETGGSFLTGQLRRVSLAGGTSVPLASTGLPFGVSWETDGTILYGQTDGVWRTSDNGAEPARIITAADGETMYEPRLLPGGEWVLFTLARGTEVSRWDDAAIVAQSLVTEERREIVARGRDARYLPTGHLVFVRDGTLFAARFDLDRLTTVGALNPVVEGVAMGVRDVLLQGINVSGGVALYDVARDGTLVYVPGIAAVSAASYQLALVSETGETTALPAEPRDYSAPRASPDGDQIAVEVTEANAGESTTHLYVVSREGGALTQVTFEGTENRAPVWTPDGTAVVFASNRGGGGGSGIYRTRPDGDGVTEPVVGQAAGSLVPLDVSADGILLFSRSVDAEAGEGYGLWTVPLDGSATPTAFLEDIGIVPYGRFSPDGRFVAYSSDEVGTEEVFVRPYPRLDDRRWRVSDSGGRQPLWARDQKSLYFWRQGALGGSPQIRATVEAGATFRSGLLTPLFGWVPVPERIGDSKDLMPGGEGFLIAAFPGSDAASQEAPQIITVYNWFEELKRLVPVD